MVTLRFSSKEHRAVFLASTFETSTTQNVKKLFFLVRLDRCQRMCATDDILLSRYTFEELDPIPDCVIPVPMQVRTLVGYVPQDDILPGTSTVWEFLSFHAALRLPALDAEAQSACVWQVGERGSCIGQGSVGASSSLDACSVIDMSDS